MIKLPGIPFLVASLICFNAHPSPMAAASALKTAAVVAICITILLVQTTVGLGYSTPMAPAPAGGGLACPGAQKRQPTKMPTGVRGTRAGHVPDRLSRVAGGGYGLHRQDVQRLHDLLQDHVRDSLEPLICWQPSGRSVVHHASLTIDLPFSVLHSFQSPYVSFYFASTPLAKCVAVCTCTI